MSHKITGSYIPTSCVFTRFGKASLAHALPLPYSEFSGLDEGVKDLNEKTADAVSRGLKLIDQFAIKVDFNPNSSDRVVFRYTARTPKVVKASCNDEVINEIRRSYGRCAASTKAGFSTEACSYRFMRASWQWQHREKSAMKEVSVALEQVKKLRLDVLGDREDHELVDFRCTEKTPAGPETTEAMVAIRKAYLKCMSPREGRRSPGECSFRFRLAQV
jgi:hypothetical protein